MMHHIICDWASEGIIWRELSTLYRSFISGKRVELPALPVTHGDYAEWQQQRLATTSFAEDLAFWEEALRGAPALLELPADRARPPMMSYRGRRQRWKLSRDLTEALRNTSRHEKTSLFTIFAAALDALLYRYSGSDDILLGIPMSDRDQQELQSVVGFLLHTHVLRTRLSGDMTFRDLLGRVQKGVLDLYMHRSAPFDQIVRNLRPERNLSYSSLFQVMLNWRDRDQQLPFIGLEGLAIDSLMAEANTSKFDLYFFVTDCGDEIWLELEYNSDLFDEDRISRMLGHYETLLEAVAADPGAQIANMPIMAADELRQSIFDWNRTEIGYPEDKCLDELFDEQVARTPDAVAVAFAGERLTYRQLADRANRLATHLQKLGVSRNTLVAICVERSLDMVVGLLGILKASGAYLPLDPSFPSERLAFMLQDAQPLVLLTQRKLLRLLPSHPIREVFFDTLPSISKSETIERTRRQSGDLAYVLYTSGSTGTPKGVQVQHRALVNFLTSMQRKPGIASSDALLAITTLSFDIAGLELYLPLMVGARVVIASSDSVKDAKQLLALMKACRPTIMQATPATWRMLLDSGWEGSPELKILCGGESWSTELANELLPRCRSLWNMYGPTETTIWSAVSRVERDQPILIGTPIANTTFYVLDPSGQPVPVGIPGQLYIGGKGLAQGYLGRADLTRERFIPNPFSSQVGARLYKTGDLVRRLPGGLIEFLRRVDYQVKLRGFRIELGEIEASLEQLASIRHCVVSFLDDGKGDKRLVAYVVPSDPHAVPAIRDLRAALKRRLPSYMIPSAFAVIEKIPHTANGKVDRKALALSNVTTITSESQIEPPRDSIEEKLIQIWERLLDMRTLGIRSNFFEMGGHSLIVIKLFAEIKNEFRLSLPIAAIFHAPTIEQLAILIRGRAIDELTMLSKKSLITAGRRGSIVPLKPEGSAEPVFIISGRLGIVVGLYRLAMMLGTKHPIYAVEAQSLLPSEPALLRLEDLAAFYISEIRNQQPNGPYYLLGHSLGGTTAFEIARQLHSIGERVEMLGMFDTSRRDFTVHLEQNDPSYTLKQRVFREFRSIRANGAAKYIKGQLAMRGFSLIYSAAMAVGFRTVPSFLKNTNYIMRLAELNYNPQPWPGSITLFRAKIQGRSDMTRDLGWEPLALGGIEVYDLPGDHDVFREPTIHVLAECLRQRLERSERTMTEIDQPTCV
jgi:amino acid adenylation domain-containing protein